MKKKSFPVDIHVETVHCQEQEKDEYVEDFQGKLIQIGNKRYLRYQEKPSNKEHAEVTFKFDSDKEIQLTRKLEHQKLHLVFQPEKRTLTNYQTPYGNIPLEAEVQQMSLLFEDDPYAGEVALDYRLWNGPTLLGNYKIRLQFSV